MRIRSIKPEFWRSDDIARLRRDVRLLFIGLWSYVDDNGVGIDDFRQISADLFALEDDPQGARNFVRDGLATLSAASLIVRYEHQGKRYLHIPTWDRHQRVDKPGKQRYPRPDDCGATIQTEASADVNGSTRDVDGDKDDAFANDSGDSREGLAPGEGEQGSRGAVTDSSSLSDAPGPTKLGTRLPDDFPITPELIAWARDKAPSCGPEDHAAFCDYWRGIPGAKGRKLDWPGAWRNWMRREHEKRQLKAAANGSGRGPRVTSPPATTPRNRWMERE
ncbi:hypothetical protein [Nonomuraea sp. NPDC050310]|uniref:hypothetical protein n=1 Tax=Nonomuraea sp. NPDC050310 TaxID=3154935 RepID=UPI003411428E